MRKTAAKVTSAKSREMAEFAAIRAAMNRTMNGGYGRFLQSLKPNYGQVWREILLGYAALALILGAASVPSSLPMRLVAGAVAAPLVGYVIAFLQLFLHEAAHYNLHRDRRWNDRLCNFFISWHAGSEVKRYRACHFAHHQKLGHPDDTEHSYFNALTPQFVIETLAGIQALRVFLGRAAADSHDATKSRWPLIVGILAHTILLAGLLAIGSWQAALAWIGGMAVFFPFFATIRQVLEHRSAEADSSADYSSTPHGACTRMFAQGPLASTFGGAGFSRHLLHHWEPHISYTRLGELEAFLEATPAADLLAANRTTYFAALKEIWRNDNR